MTSTYAAYYKKKLYYGAIKIYMKFFYRLTGRMTVRYTENYMKLIYYCAINI